MRVGRGGRKRQLDLESEYWKLLLSGVGTVAACRLLGIGRKTGYRWRAENGGPPPGPPGGAGEGGAAGGGAGGAAPPGPLAFFGQPRVDPPRAGAGDGNPGDPPPP